MGPMTKIRNGADAVTETAAEIRAEIPHYRDALEIVAGMVVIAASAITLACLVFIVMEATKRAA